MRRRETLLAAAVVVAVMLLSGGPGQARARKASTEASSDADIDCCACGNSSPDDLAAAGRCLSLCGCVAAVHTHAMLLGSRGRATREGTASIGSN